MTALASASWLVLRGGMFEPGRQPIVRAMKQCDRSEQRSIADLEVAAHREAERGELLRSCVFRQIREKIQPFAPARAASNGVLTIALN
jgi:hypothetical protein